MSTDETTVSLCLVVEKLGRIHSFNSLSTTYGRCNGQAAHIELNHKYTHVFVNQTGHLPSEVSKVNAVAVSESLDHKLLLPFMGDEAISQLFSMRIDTVRQRISAREVRHKARAY
jgi:hypothetical protein